jgi:plastocyanin
MRRTVISLAAAVGLTLAACSSEPSSDQICDAPTQTTTVEMADFSYAPKCAAVEADASIELRNTGQAPHTFTVNETAIDVEVAAGETGTVDLAGTAPGTYEVICTLHPQMEGALQVG